MVSAIQQRVVFPLGAVYYGLMPGDPTIQADVNSLVRTEWRRQGAKKSNLGTIGDVVDAADTGVGRDRGDVDDRVLREGINLQQLTGRLTHITRRIHYARNDVVAAVGQHAGRVVITPNGARNSGYQPSQPTVQGNLDPLTGAQPRTQLAIEDQSVVAGDEIASTDPGILTNVGNADGLCNRGRNRVDDHHLCAHRAGCSGGADNAGLEHIRAVGQHIGRIVIGVKIAAQRLSVMPGNTAVERYLYFFSDRQRRGKGSGDQERRIIGNKIARYITVGTNRFDARGSRRGMVTDGGRSALPATPTSTAATTRSKSNTPCQQAGTGQPPAVEYGVGTIK